MYIHWSKCVGTLYVASWLVRRFLCIRHIVVQNRRKWQWQSKLISLQILSRLRLSLYFTLEKARLTEIRRARLPPPTPLTRHAEEHRNKCGAAVLALLLRVGHLQSSLGMVWECVQRHSSTVTWDVLNKVTAFELSLFLHVVP